MPRHDVRASSVEEIDPIIQIVIVRERLSRIEEFKQTMSERLKNYDVLFRWVIGVMLAGFIGIASLILTLWGSIQTTLAEVMK